MIPSTKPELTAVDKLPEFLLTRIAEDELVARCWPDDRPPPDGYPYWVDPQGHPVWAPRSRVLVECEAKRLIAGRHARVRLSQIRCHACWHNQYDPPEWPCYTLKALALPYASHVDYQPEWAL